MHTYFVGRETVPDKESILRLLDVRSVSTT